MLAAIVPAVHLSDASTTGASIGDPVVKPFQHFDDNAQLVLIRFLQDNPSSIVFFEHKDVIVYDGNQDPNETRPMTVQVWEFDGGATIALVGHADQPGHALI